MRRTQLFEEWCDVMEQSVGDHSLVVVRTDAQRRSSGVVAVATAIPKQYVSNKRYARIMKKFGKQAAANYLLGKLPKTRTARSGELGEVLALSFVAERTEWGNTVKKLRWKGHRDMPMLGDDVLAIRIDGSEVGLLKGEAKSRERLSKATLKDAHKVLKANDGLPSPHALAFYADMLSEDGREDLADVIDRMQYVDGIPLNCVSHMMFVVSGNDAEELLRKRLAKYKGEFDQLYVGVIVQDHGDFVESVFETVGNNGDA